MNYQGVCIGLRNVVELLICVFFGSLPEWGY